MLKCYCAANLLDNDNVFKTYNRVQVSLQNISFNILHTSILYAFTHILRIQQFTNNKLIIV